MPHREPSMVRRANENNQSTLDNASRFGKKLKFQPILLTASRRITLANSVAAVMGL
jgi:hypothetical protein